MLDILVMTTNIQLQKWLKLCCLNLAHRGVEDQTIRTNRIYGLVPFKSQYK